MGNYIVTQDVIQNSENGHTKTDRDAPLNYALSLWFAVWYEEIFPKDSYICSLHYALPGYDNDGRQLQIHLNLIFPPGCTLKLCIIFMVCRCKKKSKNPLHIFDQDQLLIMGECVDPHLPNKDSYYQRFRQADGKIKFKCICNCRPSLSYPCIVKYTYFKYSTMFWRIY
jgi:hypothetical protein